jgi:hypothetical protein
MWLFAGFSIYTLFPEIERTPKKRHVCTLKDLARLSGSDHCALRQAKS